MNDYFIALIQDLLIQAFPEFNQKGWLERRLVLKAWKPYEILEVRSFRNGLCRLPIGKREPLLNDKGTVNSFAQI